MKRGGERVKQKDDNQEIPSIQNLPENRRTYGKLPAARVARTLILGGATLSCPEQLLLAEAFRPFGA